jgi:hypothetical protein
LFHQNQSNQSIVINATNGPLNAANSGLYVSPVRTSTASGVNPTTLYTVFQDSTSKEFVVSTATNATNPSYGTYCYPHDVVND